MCTTCNAQYLTYPEHELFATAANPKILGTQEAFCEGLFHVFPSPEFGIERHGCVSGRERDNCRPYAMTLVVICDNLVGRFTNCHRKHAEEFLVTSKPLYNHIRTKRPKALVLFMKHHPCHHSSGNAGRYKQGYLFQGRADTRSCATKIIQYYKQVLEPNNVKLHIVVSWLYKAFWQHAIREDDKLTVKNSLEGLTLMRKAGIQFEAMQPHHWIQLANLCSEPIDLGNLMLASRMVADKCVHNFLVKHACSSSSSSSFSEDELDTKKKKRKTQEEEEEEQECQ